MGRTKHYQLTYFDLGTPLGTTFTGQAEIERWREIDSLIYGLMSIFGSGVVQGWTVSKSDAFSLSIDEGYGNINFISARTEFASTIDNVPPNSITYVAARLNQRTRYAETVDFVLLPDKTTTDPNFVLLAEVIAGPTSIESIDNGIRQNISFIELIKTAIKSHKHRGGSLNPSKIDLSSEVKGQLASYRIAPFDANKVSSGTFDLARLPLLDHQDLSNVGILTHPQLDAFVKSLESSNKELFGEVSTSDLLQLILTLKLIHDDPNSGLYVADRTVDQNMINEFAIIPGITPDSFIDYDNTTATVNTVDHYIAGVAPTTGTSFYVTYNSAPAWNSAYSKNNIIVVGNNVSLSFDNNQSSSVSTIEGFESATSFNQVLTSSEDGGLPLFKKQTAVISDTANVLANDTTTNIVEGFWSGKFSYKQDFRVQFVKEFSESKDWSGYDSFVLSVKCLNEIHGPVKLYFYDADGNKSAEFSILEQDEVTDNNDPSENNFEMRVVDIAQIDFRTKVKGFVIYSDDTDNPFDVFVDYINIQKAVLLPDSGTVILRYSSNSSLTFASIDWSSTEPDGTDILVRARSASGTVLLSRSEYTPYLNNGDLLNLRGTDIEIEITLTPDSTKTLSPVLQSLRILIQTNSDIDGFKIDTEDEFSRGTLSNLTLDETPTVSLTTPIYVDSLYFCLGNAVNQVHQNSNNAFDGELSIFATKAPIAPNQIFASIEAGKAKTTSSQFFEPKCSIRQQDRTFVIADSFNDRVLQFNEDGELIAGFGSINYEHESKVFPIAASVDLRSGILYIVWSKKISFKTINVSKIVLQSPTQKIQLIENFDKILGLSKSELDGVSSEGQITPIYLSLQNTALIQNLPEQSYLLLTNDSLSIGLSSDSVYYKSISTSLGIPCFVGNFAYIEGISTPTYANKTDSGSFLVANASVAIKDFTIPTSLTNESISRTANVTPILEIDKNNNIIFGSDKVLFSPFTPGRVDTYDDNTLLIGGIKPGGQEGDVPATDFNFRTISGDSEEKTRRKDILNTKFFKGQKPFSGTFILLDKITGATSFEYFTQEGAVISDVDVDPISGDFVAAESSFNKSGRIVKVDNTGNISSIFGEGLYSVINAVRVKPDGSMVIST